MVDVKDPFLAWRSAENGRWRSAENGRWRSPARVKSARKPCVRPNRPKRQPAKPTTKSEHLFFQKRDRCVAPQTNSTTRRIEEQQICKGLLTSPRRATVTSKIHSQRSAVRLGFASLHLMSPARLLTRSEACAQRDWALHRDPGRSPAADHVHTAQKRIKAQDCVSAIQPNFRSLFVTNFSG